MLIRNTFGQLLYIPHRHKLGHLIDIVYKNCFFADTHSAFDAAISLFLLQHLSDHNTSLFFLPTNSFLETVLSNRVKMYENATAIKQIAELIAEYPTI